MWIRTQNRKGLIEAICITCSGGNDKYTLYADAIGFEDYVLGFYPTEARALEVLDEIQKHVIGELIIPHEREVVFGDGQKMTFYENDIQQLPTVYEMPKE